MTPEQFAYWLQGFAELNSQPPTPEQWQSIREHVAAIFKKVTPPVAPAPSVFAPKPAPTTIPLSGIEKHFEEIAKRERERERDKERRQSWPGVPFDGRPVLIC